MDKVYLKEKFGTFDEQWSPKIVGTVNDSHVKIAKIKGEFVWHHHADEDEMFLVVKGRLQLKMHEGDITLDSVCVLPSHRLQPFHQSGDGLDLFRTRVDGS